MRLLDKLAVYARVLPRARRNRTDLVKWMGRRPLLFGAMGAYEGAVVLSNRVDSRLKTLATLKATSRAGCPF